MRVVVVDFGERHRHTDKRAALHRSRPPADQSGKCVATWTGKSPDTPDTHDLPRTSSRGCHEDATRKLLSWNSGFTQIVCNTLQCELAIPWRVTQCTSAPWFSMSCTTSGLAARTASTSDVDPPTLRRSSSAPASSNVLTTSTRPWTQAKCSDDHCSWSTAFTFALHANHPAPRYYLLHNKKHLKNVGPIRHCEPPHAACSNLTFQLILVVVSTLATPGEWQCKIRTGGVRRLAVANGPNIFQMLLVTIITEGCKRDLRVRNGDITKTGLKTVI